MKKVLFLLSFLLAFIVSCGNGSDSSKHNDPETPAADQADPGDGSEPSETPDTAENGGSSDPTTPAGDTEPSETPGGNDDTMEEDPAPETQAERFCQYACETALDCVQGSASAINDEDNYKCENHKCVYLGCLNDAECEEVYESVTAATGTVYRCNKNGAYGYPECTPACSSAADCNNLCEAGTTQYAYDLDNYKCESGLCVYTGCNSDSECEATMSSSDYKCLTQEYSGKTLNVCNLPCETAADCGNMVYPEEVYLCENRQCKMKSCESDEWCAENINSKFSCL